MKLALFSTMTVAGALAGALVCFGASAAELVEGGFGREVTSEFPAGSGAAVAEPALGQDPLSMSFTPRGVAADEDPPLVRFRIDLDGAGQSERMGRLGLVGGADGQLGVTTGSSDLLVGGAVEFGDWSVGGAYGQLNLLGNQADLMSASLGYGSLSTRLSYGQTESEQGPPMDVMMLSTDLAAWSWLTLQSDVLVGSDGQTEPMAVGRFGFRLKF